MATTVRPRTAAAIDNPAYQAFLTLRIGFVVANVAGLLLATPSAARLLPPSPTAAERTRCVRRRPPTA